MQKQTSSPLLTRQPRKTYFTLTMNFAQNLSGHEAVSLRVAAEVTQQWPSEGPTVPLSLYLVDCTDQRERSNALSNNER